MSGRQEPEDYLCFGLRLRSELSLPELAKASPGKAPVDVVVRVGPTPAALGEPAPSDPTIQVRGNEALLTLPAGRYLVRGGQEIIVEPIEGYSDRDVRLYLLGSAMGVLCHQRGLLPLHANAIQIGEHAVAFVGSSGAGKSTLAAYLATRGYNVLCDDVCALTFDDQGQATAWPGVRRLKLWRDSLTALGRDVEGLDRVSDEEDYDKYSLSVTGADRGLPLGGIFWLQSAAPDAPFAIRRLHGPEVVSAIVSNTYRWSLAAAIGTSRSLSEQCLMLARGTQVYSVERRCTFAAFEAEASAMEQHARLILSE